MTEDYPSFEFDAVDFVTSDTHFGHARISELADRPFASVEEMNSELVRRWNAVVGESDTVLHLGDLALGRIEESLALTAELNGRRFLIPGNHDRVSPATQTRRAVERFAPLYEGAGWTILPVVVQGRRAGHKLLACHYPYSGDSQQDDRHVSQRPVDRGMPLIHGHTHDRNRGVNGNQFHVGVDAFNYTPIPMHQIDTWLDSIALRPTKTRATAVRDILRTTWADPIIEVWMSSANSFLDGATPTNVLAAGDFDAVMDAALQELSGGYR